MKKLSLTILALLMSGLLTGCQDSQGLMQKGGGGQNDIVGSFSISTEIDEIEKAGLLYMWEEEKLARDVYLVMAQKYGANVFNNISSSEQKHMNAVKSLLDQLRLSLPIDENQIGNFQDPTIKSLYEQLIQRGSISLGDAYQVGLDIEILDIDDLQVRMDQTDDPGIEKVYSNLLSGSFKHKAAFERMLN